MGRRKSLDENGCLHHSSTGAGSLQPQGSFPKRYLLHLATAKDPMAPHQVPAGCWSTLGSFRILCAPVLSPRRQSGLAASVVSSRALFLASQILSILLAHLWSEWPGVRMELTRDGVGHLSSLNSFSLCICLFSLWPRFWNIKT